MYMTTAAEIWKNLEKRFSLTNGSRKYKLNKDVYEIKQGSMTVNDFYTLMRSLWEELDCLNMLPAVKQPTPEVTNLLNTIDLFKEESRLFQFLNGIDEVYNSQRSQLLLMNPLPTVESACAALMQEEAQRELLQPSKNDDISAMYGKSVAEKVVVCSACGVKGHPSERCWTVIGYPKWHLKHKPNQSQPHSSMKNRSQTQLNKKPQFYRNSSSPKMAASAQTVYGTGDGLLFSPQQMEQLAKLLPKMQLSTYQSETDEELDHFSGMITATTKCGQPSLEWIIDSGASDHMTPYVHDLAQFESLSQSLKINLPTGDTVQISHVGRVKLQNGLVLEKVLCVPGFRHKLLSVQKLVKDSKCAFQFYPTHCLIVDASSGTLKGVGIARAGLYYLSNNSPDKLSLDWVNKMTSKSTCFNAAANTDLTPLVPDVNDPVAVWHHRLGHAALSNLQHIPAISSLNFKSPKVCITCPMAKFTKLPYALSDSHASSPFDLIHIDTWGPYKICTKGKYKYYLTIVDDNTRYTWVYLLQHKSDALSTLKTFLQYVHNHFDKSIKYLRSDNAMEFDDVHCRDFFAKHGIVHQTSCVYRPQQNARAERKHRHILEIARSLRFQTALPLIYWGDCVLTAVHLLNRLPSFVLNHKTPYEVLYNELPSYDHLKIFGCLAFASNPSISADKFTMRGVPCVFLGYPPTKKGYKLLDLTTMQQFVSRDVKFHESIFPFHPKSMDSYMQPLPPHSNSASPTNFLDDFELLVGSSASPLESHIHSAPPSPSSNTSNLSSPA